MGNSQSQSVVLEQYLLNKHEFNRLKVGDRIDHRDYQGRYCAAEIVKKGYGGNVKLSYVGKGYQYDRQVNYNDSPTDFAKAGSISRGKATGTLSRSQIGEMIKFRAYPGDKTCEWVAAIICEMDNKSGQVKVQWQDPRDDQQYQRFTHLDNIYEIRPYTFIPNKNNKGHKPKNGNKSRVNHGSQSSQHARSQNNINNDYNATYKNSNNNQNQYQQNLLTKQQFNRLEVGDKIDHRDYEGRYCAAEIVKKGSGGNVKVHYTGYSAKYDKRANYNETPTDFAKFRSISQGKASGPLSKSQIGDTIEYKPYPEDKTCEWVTAIICKLDDESGQVRVQWQDSRDDKQYKRFTHLDNQNEVRPFGANRNKNNNNKHNKHGNKSRVDHGSQVSQRTHSHNNRYDNHNSHGANPCAFNGSQGSQRSHHTHSCNNNNNHRPKHGHKHNSQNSQQRRPQNNNPNLSNDGNYNTNYNQQSYKQEQVQRQDQMTVRTQLLLDDTQQQLSMIKDYLGGIASGKCSKDEIKQFNQKVVCGLTLFDMKVNGMRANEKSESISFNDAFKASAMIIKKFEGEIKSQFGHNQILMQRLEPCLNYMRAVLYGHKVPPLPYIRDYEFDENIASNVLSGVAHAQNHVMPERMAEISRNNDQYKSNQQQLKKEYESGGCTDKVHDVNFNNLIQDYNTKEIAFPKSKEEQDRIIEKEQNEYRYQQPNLFDGDGWDW